MTITNRPKNLESTLKIGETQSLKALSVEFAKEYMVKAKILFLFKFANAIFTFARSVNFRQ
jgi:hypothetical protein